MPSGRPIASVTLSFGLVAIPVSVYSATVPAERISFNLLRAKDGSRVKQQYVAVKDGKPVERAEMAKGFEFAKDQFVMFSAQELKELEDKTSTAIDITEFAPLESVDPIYFAATYFLSPGKGGVKPYALFVTALGKAGQCAVGRWISRGKEHIVIVRALGEGLAMHQLHFQGEVRPISELAIDKTTVSDAELKLAGQLIEQLAVKEFDPGEYTDEFRNRVKAAIQRKVQGKEVALSGEAAPTSGSKVVDLMQALKASLDGKPGGATRSRTPKRVGSTSTRKAQRR